MADTRISTPVQRRKDRFVTTALVVSCALAFFVFGMTSAMIGPTISDLAAVLGVSVAMAGILRSGRQVGQFAGFLILGNAADKYDLRLLAVLGAAAMAVGLGFVTVHGIAVAICFTVIWGVGHGAYNLAPNVVIGRVFVARAPGIMTALHGVYGVGAMFGPWFVELLRHRGVEFIYAVSGAMVLAAGLTYWLSTRDLAQNEPPPKLAGASAAAPVTFRGLFPFLLGVLLFSGANFTASDWLYYYTHDLNRASATAAAFATSAFWFAMTAGRFLLGIATARWGERIVIRGSAVCSIAGSALLALPSISLQSIVISAMLLGLGLAAIYPILIAAAANLFPAQRGTVTGYLAAAGAFGSIVLPALQGWLTSVRGVGMVVVFLSVVLMGIALWSVPLQAKNERKG